MKPFTKILVFNYEFRTLEVFGQEDMITFPFKDVAIDSKTLGRRMFRRAEDGETAALGCGVVYDLLKSLTASLRNTGERTEFLS